MDGDGKTEFPPPVDLCMMKPNERQKVRDTWLAEPKMPHFRTYTSNQTLARRSPFGLSIPALKAKCSPHTELLAVARNPLPQMHYVTSAEREAQKELEEDMTKEELRWLKRKFFVPAPTGVRKSALTAKITPRVETMALAKLSCLLETKKNFFSKLSENQRKALLERIQEHHDILATNYPPEADEIYVIEGSAMIHATCSTKKPLPKGKKPRFLCELNRNQRRAFRRRMKALGLPKKPILPDGGPDRGPKKRLKEFEPRLLLISQPKYNVLNEVPYDPFKVKSSTKFYIPTERVLLLAKPRVPPPPPPMTDFEGNELPPRREWSWNSRRRIIASPRTIELATPRFVKKKAAEDMKEDPFAVPRRALTAICTARTAELALPRQR